MSHIHPEPLYDALSPQDAPTPPARSALRDLASALSDRANPVLVRFVRQQLKSRGFFLLYGITLLAATAFSLVIGSQAHLHAEGDAALRLLGALAVVWSLAVWVFEPISVYRAVTVEREDATWDLVELTGMRPRVVLSGLIQAAIVHSALYGAAIAPFVLMAYLLRGVDLPTVLLLLTYIPLVGLAGVGTAILAGCLGKTRAVRTLASAALTTGCIGAWLSHMNLWLDFDGFVRLVQNLVYGPIPVAVLGLYFNFFGGWVVLTVAMSAALLTSRVANRSTLPRLVWMLLSVNALAWLFLLGHLTGEMHVPFAIGAFLGAFATALLGLFAVTEDFDLTPRQARDLREARPWLRPFMVFLGPGAARGRIAYVLMAVVTACLAGVASTDSHADRPVRFTLAFLAASSLHLLVGDAISRGPLARLCPTATHRRTFLVVALFGTTLLVAILGAMMGDRANLLAFLSPLTGAIVAAEPHRGVSGDALRTFVAFGAAALLILLVQGLTHLRIQTRQVFARDDDRNPRAAG